jgi:hypothetical protein
MRRSRRNGHGGLEFGGSGEDSFVAVVVTKLTGALLFILLLTMVIMALLPKAVDLPGSESKTGASESERSSEPLAIATPEVLPEGIAGRPYAVALAATGGSGPLRWAVDGTLPEGLVFDASLAQIRGTPRSGTPVPAALVLRVSDGHDRTSQGARLVVYQSDQPLAMPSKWKPRIPPIPWRAWLDQGFGFLMLWLVHLVGMNTLGNLERWSLAKSAVPEAGADGPEGEAQGPAEVDAGQLRAIRNRYLLYRTVVRLGTVSATVGLALWLLSPHA